MIGRPRPAVDALPAYKPGKDASQAEAEHGIVEAIKLASNENPLGPLPAVAAAIEAAAGGINRYADHRAAAVRAAIAAWRGVDVDQVVVGCGSVGLLQQLLLTYVDPGDEVVYPWRSFEVYPVYTRLVGGVARTTPLVDHAFDLDAVEAAVGQRTKLVILSNPNNPTGTAFGLDRLDELLRSVPRHVIVVLDEAYREFVDPGIVADPLAPGPNGEPSLLDRHPNLVVLRTFSKAQGLAALRIGYGFAHPEVATAIDKTLFPFAVNGVAQAAAIAAIDHHAEVEARVADIVGERARMLAELRSGGWSLPDSEANFVWLPVGDATVDLNQALERRGIVARPFPGEGIRLTVSVQSENDRALAALDAAADEVGVLG